jgi:hypothetical protein
VIVVGEAMVPVKLPSQPAGVKPATVIAKLAPMGSVERAMVMVATPAAQLAPVAVRDTGAAPPDQVGAQV